MFNFLIFYFTILLQFGFCLAILFLLSHLELLSSFSFHCVFTEFIITFIHINIFDVFEHIHNTYF